MEAGNPARMRTALLAIPLYVPVLLGWGDRRLTSLAVRVEDLSPVLRARLRMDVRPVAWRDELGIWVVCVAFRVADGRRLLLAGSAYLNPRQRYDYERLLDLAQQDVFPLTILSPNVADDEAGSMAWPAQTRDGLMEDIVRLGKEIELGTLDGSFDPDFERAMNTFGTRWSALDVLTIFPRRRSIPKGVPYLLGWLRSIFRRQ